MAVLAFPKAPLGDYPQEAEEEEGEDREGEGSGLFLFPARSIRLRLGDLFSDPARLLPPPKEAEEE